ncbi:amidohydrolase family protein [Nocardioides sp. SLBN-35]|uniref:amidohydrolase family protein n=1 Tax=Nocardioides sp. SLBN-35 TaxID=2768445 RepID=UPI001151BEEF|nr:amidohydrolase family protein [Nocardioides sp. SLBN-35]TQK70640.1 imidazolonepropionase-like amidohydrolase [Nocardioides sp. SLBN-35]
MHAWRAPRAFDGHRFLAGGATVLVEGDRIVGVEPAHFAVPHDCPVTTYDATLMPGLVDAHVHLVSDGSVGALERVGVQGDDEIDAQVARSLAAQAAAGVTTVRDLGDRDYRTLPFRDAPGPGTPRIVASGPPLTTPGGHCHYLGGAAASDDDLRAAVIEHAERGVNLVKVMAGGGFLTPGSDMIGAQFAVEALRLVVDTAHGLGLPVLSHAHSVVAIEVALDAGVDGIEHFTGVTENGAVLSDDLLERTAAAGVAVDPTMGNDPAVLAMLPTPPPAILEIMARVGLDIEAFFAQRYVDVGRMRAHGVRVVPGVDAGAAPTKAHGNAWRAVLDLATAGWPLDEALAAGTSGAADACGLGAETGALRPGLAADLLVVEGDLAADPAALGRPLDVLLRGSRLSG